LNPVWELVCRSLEIEPSGRTGNRDEGLDLVVGLSIGSLVWEA
jgi:hypothetical protein